MTLHGDLHYDRYVTREEDESIMRIGGADAPPILFLPPLFEELNRARALIAAIMRRIAAAGFGCWLPDLPGTNESMLDLAEVEWSRWQDASRDAAAHVARAAGRAPAVATIRGGCLLDGGGVPTWRFAPVEGASLARDLERSSLIAAGEQAGELLDFAGYPVPRALLEALRAASPVAAAPLRTARLQSDRAEADIKIDGPALWRRSEPGSSPELADALAEDLAAWMKQCGAC